MRFINLTPHDIHVVRPEGLITIKRSGTVARCREHEVTDGYIELPVTHFDADNPNGLETFLSIPITRKRYGDVYGLPGPEEGVYYVVSYPVAVACPDRSDLLVPHGIVRDNEGRIQGCTGFSRHDVTVGA